MNIYSTYSQIDTIDSSETIQLLQEIDEEPILLHKREVVVQKSNIIEGTDSAFYGIKNSKKFPVRFIESSSNNQHQTIIESLFNPKLKLKQVEAWQSVVLILTIFLVGLAKAFNTSRFKQTYKSLFNYRVAQEICSEEKVFFHRVNVLLTLNYLLSTSLLIYQVKAFVKGFQPQTTGLFYLIIIAFLVILHFGKLLFARVLSFIFDAPNLIVDYTFNVSLFNNLMGVLLIPVLSVLYFTNLDFGFVIRFIALPLLSISLILRLIRMMMIGISKGISYFYIFLYICTLEILPLVVMIKIFILK